MANRINEGTLYASAPRTATPTQVAQTNLQANANLTVVISQTAHTSTPSTTPTIEGFDPVGAVWYTILAGAALTTSDSVTVLRVGPSQPASANLIATAPLPKLWRLTMTHGNANSQTYSAGFTIH